MSFFPTSGLASVMSSLTGINVKEIDRRVRVLIADDHQVIRMSVRSTLERHPHFEVCGEAHDGAGAIVEAEKLKPDVIVLDVSMPVLNGFEAAREITAILPTTAIVILSSSTDRAFIEEARKIGARAYVAKSRTGKELVKAIEAAVIGGDFVLLE